MLAASQCDRALPQADLYVVLGVIAAAARDGSRTAARDYVMVRFSYLIGLARYGRLRQILAIAKPIRAEKQASPNPATKNAMGAMTSAGSR
jgi:hypothetical protein